MSYRNGLSFCLGLVLDKHFLYNSKLIASLISKYDGDLDDY